VILNKGGQLARLARWHPPKAALTFGVKARRKTPLEFGMHFLRLYNTGEHRLIGGPMSTKDLATLVLLVVVVLVVVHLWFGSHASTNLQPFAGFPAGI